MKWPKRRAQQQAIAAALDSFSAQVLPLIGMKGSAERNALSMQLLASLRREEYFRIIQHRGPIASSRSDPAHPSFEAELAVVYFLQQGDIDEAAWLIFLMVYLAKPIEGWQRLRGIYGKLGAGRWDWTAVNADPASFAKWLSQNWQAIGGKFGNHRKYESLRPTAKRPMGPAVIDYVQWVQVNGGHANHFATMVKNAGNDPHVIFDAFYNAIPVNGFGRLARFDWASMLARYGLIPARAGHAYLKGATGPGYGARLLFHGDTNAAVSDADIQVSLDRLDSALNLGMEVLEDAICNWQKLPSKFQHFRG